MRHWRTATARSGGGVNVLAVDRDALHALFSTLPPLRAFVEHLIAERMSGSGAMVIPLEETSAAPSLSR